ncbi:hypothetical protein BGX38DRAFT_1224200, partial [Terfezia claveryi]
MLDVYLVQYIGMCLGTGTCIDTVYGGKYWRGKSFSGVDNERNYEIDLANIIYSCISSTCIIFANSSLDVP